MRDRSKIIVSEHKIFTALPLNFYSTFVKKLD